MRRFLIRIGAMAAKEALHIRRDPRTLYLALGMPVVMLVLFGYGVSIDIERAPIAVADGDHTAESRALVRAFTAAGELERVAEVAPGDAEALFRRGTRSRPSSSREATVTTSPAGATAASSCSSTPPTR